MAPHLLITAPTTIKTATVDNRRTVTGPTVVEMRINNAKTLPPVVEVPRQRLSLMDIIPLRVLST